MALAALAGLDQPVSQSLELAGQDQLGGNQMPLAIKFEAYRSPRILMRTTASLVSSPHLGGPAPKLFQVVYCCNLFINIAALRVQRGQNSTKLKHSDYAFPRKSGNFHNSTATAENNRNSLVGRFLGSLGLLVESFHRL